jgi:prevent-host-death family protein
MKTLNVGELKKHFSTVLKKVQAGEEIIISFGKKNEKIAVIIPYQNYKSNKPRPLGLLKGKAALKISDNFQISDEDLLIS